MRAKRWEQLNGDHAVNQSHNQNGEEEEHEDIVASWLVHKIPELWLRLLVGRWRWRWWGPGKRWATTICWCGSLGACSMTSVVSRRKRMSVEEAENNDIPILVWIRMWRREVSSEGITGDYTTYSTGCESRRRTSGQKWSWMKWLHRWI